MRVIGNKQVVCDAVAQIDNAVVRVNIQTPQMGYSVAFNGIERTSYEIIGKEMKMLSYKDDNSSSAKQQNPDSSSTSEPADIDDDIPF